MGLVIWDQFLIQNDICRNLKQTEKRTDKLENVVL